MPPEMKQGITPLSITKKFDYMNFIFLFISELLIQEKKNGQTQWFCFQ